MNNYLDGRYQLVRFKFCWPDYVPQSIERYRSKADAMAAYNRARVEDGSWPDLIDTETGEYLA